MLPPLLPSLSTSPGTIVAVIIYSGRGHTEKRDDSYSRWLLLFRLGAFVPPAMAWSLSRTGVVLEGCRQASSRTSLSC